MKFGLIPTLPKTNQMTSKLAYNAIHSQISTENKTGRLIGQTVIT
jgi:hypothetical protein